VPRVAAQEHAEEHLNAVNGLVSFADARLADMQALYVVVEERLQGMAAAQECAPGWIPAYPCALPSYTAT